MPTNPRRGKPACLPVDAPADPEAPSAPPVGVRVRIPLDDLAAYLRANNLRVVGGDPDLPINQPGRERWHPTLYLADTPPTERTSRHD